MAGLSEESPESLGAAPATPSRPTASVAARVWLCSPAPAASKNRAQERCIRRRRRFDIPGSDHTDQDLCQRNVAVPTLQTPACWD